MLKKILSGEDCASCRICCNFYREELWEMPSVSDELKTLIRDKYNIDTEYRELFGCSVFGGEFNENGLLLCPMLGEKGCVLGDDKPFECKVWPFRPMSRTGEVVITISPLCEKVSDMDIGRLTDFAERELSEAFRDEMKINPLVVKPYVEGYVVVGRITE